MQQYFNPRSPHGEQRQSLDTSSYHGHISIHAPRMGSDNTTFSLSAGPIYFNPRPRMGSDIFVSSYPFGEYIISIHAPRMGSDPSSFSGFEAISLFQSTLLAWGATNSALEQGFVSRISIHAPRMGSDTSLRPITCSASYFNPRSPHGERPGEEVRTDGGDHNFNPRSPHGERRGNHTRENIFLLISIHAPRMGSDFARTADCSHGVLISIHAPRMGSDEEAHDHQRNHNHFNPRPPHGERPSAFHVDVRINNISIHAPRMGSDPDAVTVVELKEKFQSTPPHGERPGITGTNWQLQYFNPRPRMGSDKNLSEKSP